MEKTLNRIADLKKRILSLPKRAQEVCLWHMENLAGFQAAGPQYDKAVDNLFEVVKSSYMNKTHLTENSVQTPNTRFQISEEVKAFSALNWTQQKKMIRFFRGSHKKYRSVLAKDVTIYIDNSRN